MPLKCVGLSNPAGGWRGPKLKLVCGSELHVRWVKLETPSDRQVERGGGSIYTQVWNWGEVSTEIYIREGAGIQRYGTEWVYSEGKERHTRSLRTESWDTTLFKGKEERGFSNWWLGKRKPREGEKPRKMFQEKGSDSRIFFTNS